MMLKKRTNRWVQLRALLFVPLAAGVLYSFASSVPVTLEQNLEWAYPVSDSTPTGLYGGQRKHSGIDLKANMGAEIQAAFGGVVVSSTSDPVYGKMVIIRHSNGLETLYAHNSKNAVKEGETVKAGQVIAFVGSSGKSTGSHCHFEIKKDGVSVDPETVFNTKTQTLRKK